MGASASCACGGRNGGPTATLHSATTDAGNGVPDAFATTCLPGSAANYRFLRYGTAHGPSTVSGFEGQFETGLDNGCLALATTVSFPTASSPAAVSSPMFGDLTASISTPATTAFPGEVARGRAVTLLFRTAEIGASQDVQTVQSVTAIPDGETFGAGDGNGVTLSFAIEKFAEQRYAADGTRALFAYDLTTDVLS